MYNFSNVYFEDAHKLPSLKTKKDHFQKPSLQYIVVTIEAATAFFGLFVIFLAVFWQGHHEEDCADNCTISVLDVTWVKKHFDSKRRFSFANFFFLYKKQTKDQAANAIWLHTRIKSNKLKALCSGSVQKCDQWIDKIIIVSVQL